MAKKAGNNGKGANSHYKIAKLNTQKDIVNGQQRKIVNFCTKSRGQFFSQLLM